MNAFTENFTTTVAKFVAKEGSDKDGRPMMEAQVAGMQSFVKAAQDGVREDMERMDTISFPLALLIFILMLRSVRLLLLSVSIATSIDYSLFLLSRYREEVEKGRTGKE